MDRRLPHLNSYLARMAEESLLRSVYAKEVLVVFNTTTRDHYQDASTVETRRVKKIASVTKSQDMAYVQELDDTLLEDGEHIPYVVTMTNIGLPGIPHMDDYLIIEGVKYAISKVKPYNRNVDSVLNLIVYPERTEFVDELKFHKVSFIKDKTVTTTPPTSGIYILDIIYGGNPIRLQLVNATGEAKTYPFQSKIYYDASIWNSGKLIMMDDKGGSVTYDL